MAALRGQGALLLLLLLLRRTGQAGSVRYPRESRIDGSNGVLLLPTARLPTPPTALGRHKSLAADPGKLAAQPQHSHPARRQAGSGARICTSVGPELYPSGVLGGRAGTFRVGGTGPATGTGPRSAGLGCSGAGREQCGVPAAPVPPHPSQPPSVPGRSWATTKPRGGNRSRWPHSRPTANQAARRCGQGDPIPTHIDPSQTMHIYCIAIGTITTGAVTIQAVTV